MELVQCRWLASRRWFLARVTNESDVAMGFFVEIMKLEGVLRPHDGGPITQCVLVDLLAPIDYAERGLRVDVDPPIGTAVDIGT